MKTIFTITFFAMSTVVFAQSDKKAAPQKSNITAIEKRPKQTRAAAGYMKIGDIKGESTRSKATRRRVEVLKSNKQGDPNKK